MAVTNQSTTVLRTWKIDRENFPTRRPREDFYYAQASHTQVGNGDADSDVILLPLPAGTVHGNFYLFRGAYGADGLVSVGLGAYVDSAGDEQSADINTYIDGADASAAGLHTVVHGLYTATGVNLLLTFTTGAASTLPNGTVHTLFAIYSVIPPNG